MARSPRIALAGLLLAAPASAQRPAAPPQDIAEATAACVLAAGPGRVDTARLVSDGWVLATVNAKGDPVITPLRIYGRKGSAAVLTTTVGTAADGLCVTTARIDTAKRFFDVERALVSRLGARPIKRETGETIFVTGGKVVSLVLSGKPEAPAIRISVMQMPQEKK
jgi:hypothetical protein